MWSQIVSLASAKLNPFVFYIRLALIAAVLGLISYGVWQTYDAFASRRENAVVVDRLQEKIDQKNVTIERQTQEAHMEELGRKAQDKIVTKLNETIKVKEKQTQQIVDKLQDRVVEITNDPKLDEAQKSDKIALEAINAVWEKYCSTDQTQSGCQSPSVHFDLDEPAFVEQENLELT